MTNPRLILFSLVFVLTSFFSFESFAQSSPEALLKSYLEIQVGLAADDLTAAQAGATHLLASLEGKGSPQESKQIFNLPRSIYQEANFNDVIQATKKILATEDIEMARKEFYFLSKWMIEFCGKLSFVAEYDVRIAHCPMAMGNTGADWIQVGTTVNNPYFGAKMQNCGWIKRPLMRP